MTDSFRFSDHPLSSHLLVTLQLTGIALACYPPAFNLQGHWLLLTISLVGTLIGLWALHANPVGNFSIYPELKAHARLITQGPYRNIRHPMYLSLSLMMLGIALYNGFWFNYLGLVTTVLAVSSKALREERLLREAFKEHYRRYRENSWYIFPGLF